MIISDDNFILYAAKHYDNPQCYNEKEFREDLNRIIYIRRLFKRYNINGPDDLNERLILNHIILLYNVFGTAATTILFFKLSDYKEYLKPFINILGYMPEVLAELDLISDNIVEDEIIKERLLYL